MTPLVHCADAKHVACWSAVTAKRGPEIAGVPGYVQMFCPTCRRFVHGDEVDLNGPFVLMTEE